MAITWRTRSCWPLPVWAARSPSRVLRDTLRTQLLLQLHCRSPSATVRRSASGKPRSLRSKALTPFTLTSGPAWDRKTKPMSARRFSRLIRSTPGCSLARHARQFSCIVCLRIADSKSQKILLILHAPSFTTRRRTVCTCRQPFYFHCSVAPPAVPQGAIMREKVALAYSGGLDTSIIIPWLKENYNCEVIAMIADVGQGDDIDAVVEKAFKTGATKVIVKDLREEFLNEYVFPALRAGAVYEHKYLLGTSLARPVIAKHQVEVALREGATAVAHGCTGKGNDQVRFEHAFQALAPELKVIAPWREWNFKSREDCLDYPHRPPLPLPPTPAHLPTPDRTT